jgi:hypothetical protein
MNKNDNYIKTLKVLLLSVAFFLVVVALYGAAIKTKNEILLIAIACITGIIILINLFLVLKNKNKTNDMRKIITKKETDSVSINPLGLYLIDMVWYHKKGNLSYRQLYAALLYNVAEERIIYSDKKMKLDRNLNLKELSFLDRFTVEMAFLNSIEFKQNDTLKEEKLRGLMKDDLYLPLDDIKDNIIENCKNRAAFYDVSANVKETYFVNIEGSNEAILTILSWICIILGFVLGISATNEGTILGFYVPISLSLVLTFLLTSKYRERVVLKMDKKEEIIDILNYIKYIENNEIDNLDKIYLYALNKVEDKDGLVKIFFIE